MLNASAKPLSANFMALYTLKPYIPQKPDNEEVITILPQPLCFISLTTALVA